MKKLVAVAVLALASMSMVACGSSEPSNSPQSMAKTIATKANKALKDMGMSATVSESCLESKLSSMTAAERTEILNDQAKGEAWGEKAGPDCASTN